LIARFLNYFPQYRLSDLREMPFEQFMYLAGGMFDNIDPDRTTPFEDKVTRAARELAMRVTEKVK
jgi:hypothetical protein